MAVLGMAMGVVLEVETAERKAAVKLVAMVGVEMMAANEETGGAVHMVMVVVVKVETVGWDTVEAELVVGAMVVVKLEVVWRVEGITVVLREAATEATWVVVKEECAAAALEVLMVEAVGGEQAGAGLGASVKAVAARVVVGRV